MRFPALLVVVAVALAACSGSATDLAEADTTSTSARHADDSVGCGVDAIERTRLLGLSADEFDQDMNGGWRAVANQPGCELVAVSLLEAYIAQNEIEPGNGVMHWHAGQLLALAGENEAAVPWLEAGRSTDPAGTLYADGTIAFLTNDRAGLEAAIVSLADVKVSESEKAERRRFLEDNPDVAMRDGFIDEPANLSVLAGLLTCFGQPYSVAYGCEP